MHGLIHTILKKLVVTKWGEQTWIEIGNELKLDTQADGWDQGILEMKQHDDSVTVAGVQATSKVLGVSWDDALRVYGGFFVEYVHMGDHLRLLQSMGDNLVDFMVSRPIS